MADEVTKTEEVKVEETKVEEKPIETKVDETEQLRERAAKAEARAAEAERKAQELSRRQPPAPTDAEYKKWFEEKSVEDPFGATAAVAEDRARRIVAFERFKDDAVDDIIDKNPKFKPFEREIKRRVRNYAHTTPDVLTRQIELECYATLGRNAENIEIAARRKGKEDVEKGKRLVGQGGIATGTTIPKSQGSVTLNAEETMMAGKMGLSVDKVKEAQAKGKVVE